MYIYIYYNIPVWLLGLCGVGFVEWTHCRIERERERVNGVLKKKSDDRDEISLHTKWTAGKSCNRGPWDWSQIIIIISSGKKCTPWDHQSFLRGEGGQKRNDKPNEGEGCKCNKSPTSPCKNMCAFYTRNRLQLKAVTRDYGGKKATCNTPNHVRFYTNKARLIVLGRRVKPRLEIRDLRSNEQKSSQLCTTKRLIRILRVLL